MEQIGLFDVDNARLVRARKELVDGEFTVPPHSHAEWEFTYFVRGSGSVYAPSQTLSLRDYHLFVNPPGLLHAGVANPKAPAEFIYARIQAQGPPLTGIHLLTDATGELGWLFQRILFEYTTEGVTDVAQAYTKTFLCLVNRALSSGATIEYDAVGKAVQYIHANHDRPIGLEELAAVACVTKSHLDHRFRAKLKTSPLRYIREVRLDSAKRLLATTNVPVQEIAAQVGFTDPYYFSRVFKRAMGSSPTAFRRAANCAE